MRGIKFHIQFGVRIEAVAYLLHGLQVIWRDALKLYHDIMRKDIAVGNHHGAFLARYQRTQLKVLYDADNSQRILVANRRVDELLTNDVIDASHFFHFFCKLLVHQHLLRPAFMIQAFEVAAANNLKSHCFHQSTLGKEQIDSASRKRANRRLPLSRRRADSLSHGPANRWSRRVRH